MSRPRAATSVATRTRIEPFLKPSSARVRSGCERSEWIATASMPFAIEPVGQPRRGQLRPGEDEDLAHVVLADQVGEKGFLAVAVDRVDQLVDGLEGRVPRRDLDRGRIAQDPARQAPDVVRERGREHQVLPLGGEQRDDLLDVGQEAHVEHPVGLVEDEDLDLAEIGDLLPDEVEEAPGCGDEDLDAAAKRLDLGIHRDPAVDDGRAQRDRPAVGPHALVDLHREFAGRDEDQHPDGVTGRREARVRLVAEAVEDGQDEGGRLAGAGLRSGEDVSALEDERDGRLLDGGRGRIPLLGDHAHEVGRQAE